MSKLRFFYRFLVMLFLGWGLSGCAPSVRPPEVAEEEAPSAAPTPERPVEEERVVEEKVEREVAEPEVDEEVEREVAEPEVKEERFDPENPNWELRLQMLVDQYRGEFKAPEIGERVGVRSTTGRVQEGVLAELSESSLVLAIGSGEVTLHAENLREDSRAQFFVEDFSRQQALRRARAEHEAWTARNRRETAQRPIGGSGGGTRLRNDEPSEQVRQVEQYIRQNTLVPHSLQIEEWGRVQRLDDVYKVRVRFSLLNANVFGRSHKDMIFFIRADGSVYQRMPYRGN